jgi:pentatricopeptide repeat protein
MFYRKSIPPLSEFTKVLSFIVNLKEYDSAIYLIKKFDFLGVKPDVIPSIYVFNIAVNCFCHLKRVQYGFAVLGTVTKLGYKPDCATYNPLIRGLCGSDRGK